MEHVESVNYTEVDGTESKRRKKESRLKRWFKKLRKLITKR